MDLHWRTLPFAQLDIHELYGLLQLRQAVFVVEQQSIYLDADGRDQQAWHMLCTADGALAAYQRLLPPGASYPESSVGRLVVHPERRGRDLGRELVRRGIAHNLARWPGHDICISAQAHLQALYGSFGFRAEGGEYLEDGIPHRKMRYPAS